MLVAIIDIGSNSVRLVFYDYAKGYPQAIFNEKVTCTLGDELQTGGLLNPAAKDKARQTIKRFAALIKARKPRTLQVLATAAIREAKDGKEFADELSDILGHNVNILSGEEESLYAAYGVIATTWQPCGIVVDMGGGSTDISYISAKSEAKAITSIAHGSLYFAKYLEQHGSKKLEEHLQKLLKPLATLENVANIYPVGGSFRAIASHHMARINYPLHIIHDYELSTQQMKDLREKVDSDIAANNALIDVPKRRQNGILPAILCLQKIAEISKSNGYIFSSAGIREGALSVGKNLHFKPSDPLIAMMRCLHSTLINEQYVHQLCSLISDILPLNENQRRILLAFCYVSEIAANMHPDYRAEYAFERIIAIQGYGLRHAEQVTLALCCYFRYRHKLKLKHATLSLINEEQQNFAYIIGRIANIAYCLSAGDPDITQMFDLQFNQATKQLEIKYHEPNLVPQYSIEITPQLNELIHHFIAA